MAQGPSHVYTPPSGVPPLEGVPPLGVPPAGAGAEQQYHETWGQANESPIRTGPKLGTPAAGVPPKWGPKMGPKSHSYFDGSDGRQCDFAHSTLSGEAPKQGPRDPVLDPILRVPGGGSNEGIP